MPTQIERVTEIDHIGFWSDESDNLNYRVVPEFLAMNKCQLARLAGVSESSVRYDTLVPAELSSKLGQLANIVNRVATIFEGDMVKTGAWFRTPNPLLGEASPREMLCEGRCERLSVFISEAERSSNSSACLLVF